jgi:hypothetical protein
MTYSTWTTNSLIVMARQMSVRSTGLHHKKCLPVQCIANTMAMQAHGPLLGLRSWVPYGMPVTWSEIGTENEHPSLLNPISCAQAGGSLMM